MYRFSCVKSWFDSIWFRLIFSSLFTPHWTYWKRWRNLQKVRQSYRVHIKSTRRCLCHCWVVQASSSTNKSWPTATSGDLTLISLTLFSQVLVKQGGRGIFLFHWWASLIYHLSPDQRPTVGRKLPGKVSLYIERNLLVSTGGVQASPQHHWYMDATSIARWGENLVYDEQILSGTCGQSVDVTLKDPKGKFRWGKPKMFL